MSREELRQAIAKPAERVSLAVEPELVDQMIREVIDSPGSLPLLQYTLTELWNQRTEAGLRLTQYSQLGGITGTLQKRATEVYKSFSIEQRSTVQHIFLALTQLGEGTEDTRRRVLLTDLVNAKHPEAIVNEVVQRLANEKLIVTSEMIAKGAAPQRVAVVDVAHEALIRHWALLRSWLEESRDRLRQLRKLEAAANEWRDRGQKPDDLIQGRTLTNAQQFQKEQLERDALNSLVKSFIQKSVKQRRLNRWKVSSFLVIPAIVVGLSVESYLREEGVKQDYKRLDSSSSTEERAAVESLVAGCAETRLLPSFLSERMFGNCRSLSKAPLETANLANVDLRRANLIIANLQGADLERATLYEADLRRANLVGAKLVIADLRETILLTADLTTANLSGADLSGADLSNARLKGTILLSSNLRYVKELSQEQLVEEGEAPILCNVALPQGISVNPNRDCDRLPQILLERHPRGFNTLEEAKAYVDDARKKKWDN